MASASRDKEYPHIAVVIPAANEEKFIARALTSIYAQKYPSFSVITVINGCKDETEKIAREMIRPVDIILSHPNMLGYSRARNTGAWQADLADIIVFLDADSYMSPKCLSAIARAWKKGAALGTVRGQADRFSIIHGIIFLARNFAHLVDIYRGVLGGLFYCDAKLFKTMRGYDLTATMDEHHEFISRARTQGEKYVFVLGGTAYTSMRRHDREGIFKILFFWIKVGLQRKDGKRSIPEDVKVRIYEKIES